MVRTELGSCLLAYHVTRLKMLRSGIDGSVSEPVVALRLPPANGSNPSGVETDASVYELSFSNNAAERAVKIPAIGRKNYLFVVGINGGQRAAIHYSMVRSAKANGVEPFAWLKDVYPRLPYHRDGAAFSQAAANEPVTSPELDDLLPDLWLQVHPDHKWTIDDIRRKERQKIDL